MHVCPGDFLREASWTALKKAYEESLQALPSPCILS